MRKFQNIPQNFRELSQISESNRPPFALRARYIEKGFVLHLYFFFMIDRALTKKFFDMQTALF
jgi:hypothetical protein